MLDVAAPAVMLNEEMMRKKMWVSWMLIELMRMREKMAKKRENRDSRMRMMMMMGKMDLALVILIPNTRSQSGNP